MSKVTELKEKITLGDVVRAYPALQLIANISFKGKTSYAIMRLTDQAKKQYEFYIKTREEIIKRLGKKLDNGDISISDATTENKESFSEEMKELENQAIDLNFYEVKTSNIFNNVIDEKELKPAMIVDILKLLKDDGIENE